MEILKNPNNTSHTTRNFLMSILLAGILGMTSCGKTTQKDINEQQQKVNLLSHNISQYIEERKKLADQYNTILNYPRTESNQYEIDNHLSLLEEQIEEYDEKIKDLVEEKLDAEVSLNEKIEDRGVAGVHTPVDPNKRDYLLQIN